MQTIDPIKPYQPHKRAPRQIVDLGPPPKPRGPAPNTPRPIDDIKPPHPRSAPQQPSQASVRNSSQPSITAPSAPSRHISTPKPTSPATTHFSPQSQPLRPPLSVQPSPVPPTPPQTPPTVGTATAAIERLKRSSRQPLLRRYLFIGALAALLLIILAWATGQPMGYILVILYGVAAVVKRIPSRTSFKLAFAMIVLAPVSTLVLGQGFFSPVFATYAFLLLVVGTISLAQELRTKQNNGQSSQA